MESNNQVATINNQGDEVEPVVNGDMEQVINAVPTNNRAQKVALVNAMLTADKMLADCVGQEIELAGVYAETHYSQKKQKQVCRVLVLGKDGISYATGSFVFMNSLKAIIGVFGNPSEENPIKIQVLERSMEKGNAIIAKVVE